MASGLSGGFSPGCWLSISPLPSRHSYETGIPKPLGYWLKHIHNRLEANLAAQLRVHGLNRRSWQVLNTIAHGPVDLPGIDRALEPFREPDEPSMAPVVSALADRGLVASTRAGYLLTSTGIELHASAADSIHAGRLAATREITPRSTASCSHFSSGWRPTWMPLPHNRSERQNRMFTECDAVPSRVNT